MTEKPRFSITLDDDLFERVEKYRYEKRISTRSKAATNLISIALDFIDGKTNDVQFTHDEIELLEKMRKLNKEGTRLMNGYADSLSNMGYIKSNASGMVEETA